MVFNKGQYINLEQDSEVLADGADMKYYPEVRTIKMSGKRWGWVWNHPRGIVLQKGKERKRVPIIDFTRIFEAVIYGVSFVLFAIGAFKKFARNGGENHG